MRISEKDLKMIERGAFIPINVRRMARMYFRERLAIHGESMKAYKEVGQKFGRSQSWVRRAVS